MNKPFGMTDEQIAALGVRRKRVAYLYTEERKTITEISRQLGIGHERVRQDLIRMDVPRRTTRTSAPRVRKPDSLPKGPRKPTAEQLKRGAARYMAEDASKIPLLSEAAEAVLFAGRLFDDHENPIAGYPVSINPRAIHGSYIGSNIGCSAAMCAGWGDNTLNFRVGRNR